MPEPIAEQIVANVKTRLAVYTTTQRSTRVATWQPKDLVIVVYQGAIARNDELSHPGNPPAQAWDMEVVVAGLVKPSDTVTTAVDTFKNRFWSEIVKAANTGTAWHTWGGLAINSIAQGVEDFTDDTGAIAGVKVTFLITFRTDENNPFNVRA
jgi:cytochrome b